MTTSPSDVTLRRPLLEQLVSMDVGTYPGLETAGGGWTIEYIERTLFEMAPKEREETGF